MSKITRKITSCYCINLRRAANSLTSYYDSVMEPLGISITQFSLLSSISKLEHCSVSDLATHIGLERTTVVRTLKPLLKKGYVEDTSEEGKRNRNLQLTSSGHKMMAQARPLWQQAQDKIAEEIGIEEMESFIRTAMKLTK